MVSQIAPVGTLSVSTLVFHAKEKAFYVGILAFLKMERRWQEQRKVFGLPEDGGQRLIEGQ